MAKNNSEAELIAKSKTVSLGSGGIGLKLELGYEMK